jgi:group I intron endonuclease
MVIYKTTNLINGKFYIGQDSKNNSEYLGSGLLLSKAIDKYGRENFKKEILEVCENKKTLNEREIYWIKELKAIECGYNLTKGGSGGDTYIDNPNLPEILKKLSGESNHFYNKHHSDVSKSKISESNIGRKAWNKGKTNIYSREHLDNLSDIRKSLYSGKNHPRYINIDKQELVDFLVSNDINKAARHFNVSVDCIRKKIKEHNIIYKKIKVQKSSLFYVIDDELFNKIILVRDNEKKSVEELAKLFGIGINKLRTEFKNRKIIIKRIR